MSGPSGIRRILEQAGVAPKKRWGQNFLINAGARERLVSLLAPRGEETVWEIGGGTGVLTSLLIPACARLVVFEIDFGLMPVLEELVSGHGGGGVVPGDFCATWAGAAEKYGAPDLVVGNLPYRSASMMIATMASSGLRPRRLLYTVQKELAERMAARPSTKAYSSFSILCQARYRIRAVGDLAPRSFYPAPHVSSRIVLLEPRETEVAEADLRALERVARLLFSTRRKTIRRSLSASSVPRTVAEAVLLALAEEGIGTDRRPEEITVDQFLRLGRSVGRRLDPSDRGEGLGGSEDADLPED